MTPASRLAPRAPLGLGIFTLALLVAACAKAPRPISPPTEQARAAPHAGAPAPSWLLETATAARAAGAGALEVLGQGSGVPGDSLSGLVNIPEGRCALLYARGSATIEDLDLLIFGEDGSELGADEATDAHPTVLLCPEHAQRVHVSARVVQGRGLFALGVQDVAASERAVVSRTLGTSAAGQPQLNPESWPGLEAALAAHREQLGGRWLDLRRVAVPVDSRVPTLLSADIPANRCLDALVLGSDDVSRLDLDVLDDTGRIFARGQTRGPQRWVVLCTGVHKTTVSLEVRPQAGRGLALFLLSSSRDPRQSLGLREGVLPLDASRAPLSASGAVLEQPSPVRQEHALLQVGSVRSIALNFRGCARLELAPEEPLLGYEAQIWSKAGLLLAEVESVARTPLFACLPEAGARLDLLAVRRGGPLRIDIAAARPAPSLMTDLPLAAARLLGQLAQRSANPASEALPVVARLELSRERLSRLDLQVPAGRCLELFAALDAGGWGMEVRLLDTKSDEELAFERGLSSTFVRVCADARASRNVVAELRTSQGQAAALWTSRTRESR